MKRSIIPGLLLSLALIPFSSVWAGDTLTRINKTETLRVGMTGSQPPFNFRSKDGDLMGMDVDLARLLAGAMGVRLEIVPIPFTGLLDALEAGEVDIVLSGVTATLQRNLRVAFVGPYYVSGKSLLTKSSTLASIEASDEINQKALSIATLRGSTGETFVKRVAPKASLEAVLNYDDGIELLLNDEVDIFLADAPIIQLTALRYADADLVQLKRPLTVEPIGIALPPDDPLLLNLVENYLDAVTATGGLEALHKKWFENGAWLVNLP
jgi:polar amino acid transport system substrate-binding protein